MPPAVAPSPASPDKAPGASLRGGILLVGAFVAGLYLGHTGLPLSTTEASRLKEAVATIKAQADSPLSDKALVSAAIQGMAQRIDPYSRYFTPEELADFRQQMSGLLAGIGVELVPTVGGLRVTAVLPDSPAARGGLQVDDTISAVAGQTLQGLTFSEAVNLIRGPVGTEVALDLARPGRSPTPVKLRRALVEDSGVQATWLGGVLRLRVAAFRENTLARVQAALSGGDRPRGVVLDLRGNPGGLLTSGVGVASAFLPSGWPVVDLRHGSTILKTYTSAHPDALPAWTLTVPLVVLVDEGSASAAELVMGALQAHHRAHTMGWRTYGKGSMQEVRPLSGGGALKVTEARYFTPAGACPDGTGLLPAEAYASRPGLVGLPEARAKLTDAQLGALSGFPDVGGGKDMLLNRALAVLRKSSNN